jgi:geranylgeranylglycerol-phosphate geranylgeranyltransferase
LMTKSRILGMLRLFRFELPLFAGLVVVLGEVLALNGLPSIREVLLGFLSVFFISASALILNDYFDIETDRINTPDRPLPSGQVTEKDVLRLSILVLALGFTASGLIGSAALVVAVLIWCLGFLYNWRLKRTGFLGNLLVSISVGMTFIYGGITVGQPFETIVWVFGSIAMLVDLGEEIAADAIDMEGDRAAGSRSLAITLGKETALRISSLSFLAVVLISFVPFLFGWLELVYLPPMLITDAIILFGSIKLLSPRTEKPLFYIRMIYFGASAAMFLLLVMRLILA